MKPDEVRKTLRGMLEELERADRMHPLLYKLMHHHRSQSRENMSPVTKEYNGQLAEEIKEALGI